MLFLGRFHFKKGIESLLAAWQLLHQRRVCEHWLALVGLGDGGVLTQHLLASPILRTRVIRFLYGEANVSSYPHASGFMLLSCSEGLPMAALEAMRWLQPYLLSKACNLPVAFEVQAAWNAPPDAAILETQPARRVMAAKSNAKALAAMGASSRSLVEQQFSWLQVATQTSELSAWLLGEVDQLEFVNL